MFRIGLAGACAWASLGCGRIRFDELANGDAGNRDAPCALGGWTTPQPLTALNTSMDDSSAAISADGLTLYFTISSTTMLASALYVATRATRSDSFVSAQPIPELSLAGTGNSDPSPSGDALEIWFTRVTLATSNRIYTSTRTTTSDPWGVPMAQTQLDNASQVAGPYLTPDGLTLYFNSCLDAPTEGAILVATRATRSASFPAGTPVTLNTGALVGFPALSGDQLTLYFESETGPAGQTELWQASRATVQDSFGSPTRVPGIGITGKSDTDVSSTADGRELYFSSDRGGANLDLYVSTRACL